MSDYINRADALALFYPDTQYWGDDIDNKLLSLPSAETHEIRTETHERVKETHDTDLISRADAIEAIDKLPTKDTPIKFYEVYRMAINDAEWTIDALPSADAVQGWRIGKPTEQGKYMVTLDSFGHKHIDLFYYGKPMMPNRKVRGRCWYRSDDEWGDVVYDDTDILAWMPLPKPYKGGAE